MAINLHNEPCDCGPGVCMAFVEPPEVCINRLRGEVVTRHCDVCDPGGRSEQWHHEGVCLRCKWIKDYGDD
jgi:hypothetical protein